jgi:nucleotide-binding universal stress UspA family protein
LSWSNILAPLLGGEPDAQILDTSAALAAPFNATVTAAYASSSPATLYAWSNDSGIGLTDLAIAEFQRLSTAGEARARDLLAALDYPHKAFQNVTSSDWLDLRVASRLADVVVWPTAPARGHGFFAGAFQQILMDERRPVLIADRPVPVGGVAVVAWDGGREASRAARRAVPWLTKAKKVVVLTAPLATANGSDDSRLIDYLADQGVHAEAVSLSTRGEAGPLLLDKAREFGATLLVAGAFGHPRLQRFIFGGTTQILLDGASDTALFLSH